ncbi:MAG TPA: tyrosine--tRNA ligase [Gemmatimonadaceae bacterium]|nr:tyrosine--tRNA ligase [Gemmatimonadaceae bacterium]
MPERPTLLDELAWRGLLHQQTEGAGAFLAAAPRVVYCGFDPTAPSLHIGNLVPVMLLVHLARAGHRCVALVGGGTAMIGDPSGRSTERPLLDRDAIDAQADRIHGQLLAVFRAAGTSGVTLANNASWLREVRVIDFMRDVGKHFSVNYMLAKDSVQSRLDAGISYTEFSYMLLQSYDFLELHRLHGVTVQVGGSDQWGNLTAGVELLRRSAGVEAHALTAPLVTTASGRKFGKTEGGAVWLDPAMTSPYRFYQFWINTEDADAGRYLRMFTFLSRDEIEPIEAAHAATPQERGAQRALARAMTTMLHGEAATRVVEAASRTVFDRKVDAASITDDVFATLAREIPSSISPAGAPVDVLAVLEQAFGQSRSAGRKLLQQGAVTVNARKLGATDLTVPATEAVRGRWFLVRKGGRDVAVVEISGAA